MTQDIKDKRFLFWRVLVALAHADHHVDQKEEQFFIDNLNNTNLTENEKAQLLQELKSPQDPIALFETIDNPKDQAECLYMAHMVFASDDDYSPIEREMYNKISAQHHNDMDIDAIYAEVEDDVSKKGLGTKSNSPIQKAIDLIVNFLY